VLEVLNTANDDRAKIEALVSDLQTAATVIVMASMG
jgi:hypothetical protein